MIAGRRQFLMTALGAAAASVGGGALLRTAVAQESALTETPLREDLSLITGAGSNVLVLRAAGAAALVDSGTPESADELAKLVRGRLGLLTVELLFNTHWHPAHTGGNEALSSGDTEIVAHELTRLWMSTEYYVDWEDTTYTPRRRSGFADADVLRDRSATDRDRDGRRGNRVRPLARGAYRRRHLRLAPNAQRARRRRRRDVRRIPGHRLCDGRLDRRARRRDEEAARPSRTPTR